ncbi:hypothetical protein Cfor_02802 [Coptotermes formosanus]|uniref:Uncharacterized protein n=1 Tax=Coptotermes formosanus TaxID=36987 RepID=A0A6L2Q494_COPFO|nr:hypothetical protein Cfor_02802 [Coptotermes formosanus]
MTNDARCTHQIKSSITTAKAAFNNKTPFTNKLGLNLMKKLVKCYSYGAETLTLWKVDWKYLERLEMRNCLLKHIIEGKVAWLGRAGGRCKQLLHDLKETERYWNLKEEALNRTAWRACFRRAYGPVTRWTM